MKKLPRIARISRRGENPAQPYPPHRRSAARSNILAPVAQASAAGCFLKKLPFGCVCLRDGSQDVGRRPPVWGVGLLGLRVCAGFIRALIREIRAIRGCFVFCGFINATEFLMSMNDAGVARALWFKNGGTQTGKFPGRAQKAEFFLRALHSGLLLFSTPLSIFFILL
jgi:hypothetical protein